MNNNNKRGSAESPTITRTYDLFSESEYPGSDRCSFGFRSDGSILYRGQAFPYTQPLHEKQILGLLADLNTGTLSLYADGQNLGAAFGVDSSHFDRKQQKEQGNIIRSQHLIPAFAIKGLCLNMVERGREGEGDTGELSEEEWKINTKISSEYEGLEPQGIVRRTRSFSRVRRQNSGDNIFSTASTGNYMHRTSSYTGSESGFTIEGALRNALQYINIEDCPTLSINFGGFGFEHRPPDATSCDAYLSFKADYDTDGMYAEERPASGGSPRHCIRGTQVTSTGISATDYEDSSTELGGGDAESELRALFQKIRFQRSLDYRFTSADDDTMRHYRRLQVSGKDMSSTGQRGNYPWLPPEGVRVSQHVDGVAQNNSEKKGRVEIGNRGDIFPDAEWTSWSNFPPQSFREERACSLLQAAVRRFLGRRYLKSVRDNLIRVATIVQRRFRKVLPKIQERNRQASLQLQRMWRGVRGRALYRLVRTYRTLPDNLEDAAVQIQCCVRRLLAWSEAAKRAKEFTNQIIALNDAVCSVQAAWRAYKRRQILRTLRRGNVAACTVQRRVRGFIERRRLRKDKPLLARKLLYLATSIRIRLDQVAAVITIQRAYRGHEDREYVKTRRVVFNQAALAIQRAWRYSCLMETVKAWYDDGVAQIIYK